MTCTMPRRSRGMPNKLRQRIRRRLLELEHLLAAHRPLIARGRILDRWCVGVEWSMVERCDRGRRTAASSLENAEGCGEGDLMNEVADRSTAPAGVSAFSDNVLGAAHYIVETGCARPRTSRFPAHHPTRACGRAAALRTFRWGCWVRFKQLGVLAVPPCSPRSSAANFPCWIAVRIWRISFLVPV